MLILGICCVLDWQNSPKGNLKNFTLLRDYLLPLNFFKSAKKHEFWSVIKVDWHSRLRLKIKTYFPVYKLVVRFCQIRVKYHSAILQILGEIAFEKNCFSEHSFLQSLIGFHLLEKYYFIFPHKNMFRKSRFGQEWWTKKRFVAFLSNIRINRWEPT